MDEIRAAQAWKTNAHMIADVAKLYLPGELEGLDATYGKGRWWSEWQPKSLVRNDLYGKLPVQTDAPWWVHYKHDFTNLPDVWTNTFDFVAFDPPYRLNGTPDLEDFDKDYGIDKRMSWQARHLMIHEGITNCSRVLKENGILLLKCQNQVASGKVRWQADEFTRVCWAVGCEKIDQFYFLQDGRPQPGRQVHARNNLSTLLVLRKTWK